MVGLICGIAIAALRAAHAKPLSEIFDFSPAIEMTKRGHNALALVGGHQSTIKFAKLIFLSYSNHNLICASLLMRFSIAVGAIDIIDWCVTF